MMRIDIISAVPNLLQSPLNTSIIKRAQDKKKCEIVIHDLRDYTHDKHKIIDDKPFGGGPGMLLKPEPFFECIEKLQNERNYGCIILTTPKGRIFNQSYANKLSLEDNIPQKVEYLINRMQINYRSKIILLLLPVIIKVLMIELENDLLLTKYQLVILFLAVVNFLL